MVFMILQWNARSLCSNGQEFKSFVDEMTEKPHVICVQETWLKPQLDFIMYGYVAIRRDREGGMGGGVVTFIQQGLGYRVVSTCKELEAIVVEVWIGNSNVWIVNFYNPCRKLSKETFNNIIGEVPNQMVWCGDFNAHSTLWGSTLTDYNGCVVEEFLEEMDLVCLNDGRGTRIDVGRGVESSIDLTLVSEKIAGVTTWEVLDNTTIGSDHYPICCEIGVGLVQLEEVGFPRWKLKDANWTAYSMFCSVRLQAIKSDSFNSVDDFNSKITEVLHSTAVEIIGKGSGVGRRKMVPWWSEDCKTAIQARNKAFRKVKATFCFNDMVAYKKAQAHVRRVIRQAKRQQWQQFCNEIGREIQISDVWGMIRRMGGIRRELTLPAIRYNNKVMISNKDKAEALARTFVRVHSSVNLTPEARAARSDMLRQHPNIHDRKRDFNEAVDVPFSLFELKRALAGVRATSPGKDEICYKMVECLTPEAQEIILQLYNKIWEAGTIPLAWKHSVVIPIGKPGKDKCEATSYRPIALTSNMCKVMERMVTSRLTYVLESRNLFSCHQSGFRKGRTTMDPVVCLENEVRKAQANKEQVNAVFFDVEKAYDMLWKDGLLIKLESIGIGGRMYNWVMDFLRDRSIEVRVGSSHSNIYSIENGTPQGSVCSPILFNIMINDIFSGVDASLGRSLYADDGALWARGRNAGAVQAKLQAAVCTVEEWGNKWGFRFSVEKTQVICFSKKRVNPKVQITLYGQSIKQVLSIRFLGVWMDHKLTYGEHIQRVTTKCKKAINVMRCLVGSSWGASMGALRHIYTALIRSALDYACIVYGSAAKSHLQKLD